MVRAGADPGLRTAIAAAITRLDPELPTQGIRPLAELVGDSLARQRFALALFAIFSAVGLLLAAVGLYGMVSHAVAQRTREIGIRLALGAQARDIVRLVAGQGLGTVGLGLLAGVAGALLLTRFLGALLFGVSAHDPLTYAAMVALLSLVAAAASFLPARRAIRVPPMTALRSD